ncbi:ornithine--oxo-acid transaminase [Paenibacillus herberti]|uniref:Ornithine aminotransferase n=1 Tax=Paenibacillus herberti TaxID=1619309 RepID=A0A229NTM3_9BACL|nr:ornithine--oxo-acid transaminase [Paenibacillus herberti]OXM13184.1 ornithine--oxo-acid transaminase [Paenibacillus herberti]
MNSAHTIEISDKYAAHNYHPLPVVIEEAEGVWVKSPEGKKYMDFLSAYSALNHGHRHPALIAALKNQADRVTLTSRAFHSTAAGEFYEKLAAYTGKSKIIAMNTGAEAVETALKAARRWGYRVKGVPDNEAEIIVCSGNFHGRTLAITSFSSHEEYRSGFGPFLPGFIMVPYGDLEAMEAAISDRTAAVLVEPIQGEAGIVLPPEGYLRGIRELCDRHHVLFIADEIQTGFGRTGKPFACDRENVTPDLYVMGKALGGGILPISAVAADEEVLGLFEPGSHGSTFGGNPLACAVASAALDVLEQEDLAGRSLRLGELTMQRLREMDSPIVKEIRGSGLFIGVELHGPARPYCEQLMQLGLLCKETHENTIRLAPPLTITEEELDWALERLRLVLVGEAASE